MEKRIPPSARLEQAIADLLDEGSWDPDRLGELGRLGAQLILQRAVEEEVAQFLGRHRYERAPEARGWRNGTRRCRVHTAEGELAIAVPQVRGTLERFVCRTIPGTRTIVRTRPLEALVIGAYLRGLSDRDLESLLQEAGLGRLSRSSASRVCQELRERYRAFCARSLAGVELLALFLDAVYLPTRPSGAKEGVLVAWGYDLNGKRVLLAVTQGVTEDAASMLLTSPPSVALRTLDALHLAGARVAFANARRRGLETGSFVTADRALAQAAAWAGLTAINPEDYA